METVSIKDHTASQYKDAVNNLMVNAHAESNKNELQNALEFHDRCQRNYIDAVRNAKRYFLLTEQQQEIITRLEKTTTELKIGEKVYGNIQAILKNKKVRDVIIDIQGASVIVETIELVATNLAGKMFAMGEYEIHINIAQNTVKMYNKTRKVTGYWGREDNHPHVSGAGNACFGAIGDSIAQTMAQYEYDQTTALVIAFLESINERDAAGAYFKYWPTIDEHGNIQESTMQPKLTYCEYCHENFDDEDLCHIIVDGAYTTICDECFAEQMRYCAACDEHHDIDNTDMERCVWCDEFVCCENEIYDEDRDLIFCSEDHYQAYLEAEEQELENRGVL